MKTTVSAGDRVEMNFYFKRQTIGIVKNTDMYVEVTYKHVNEAESKTVRLDGSVLINSSGNWVLTVADLNACDCYEEVTVKIYDLNGNEKASVTDSIMSCMARGLQETAKYDIYAAMTKFVKSAYAYVVSK